MATAAQNAANFANAQFSTGPITDAGKEASSRNSLKHGLTAAQTILLPGEDEAAYRALCDRTFQEWKPARAQEEGLVQVLCNTLWRLERCSRLEAVALSGDTPDMKTVEMIGKHEARLNRQYTTVLRNVTELITDRIADEQVQMNEAVVIRRADKARNVESNFKAIGFDLSVEQVDAHIPRLAAFYGAQAVLIQKRAATPDPMFKQ